MGVVNVKDVLGRLGTGLRTLNEHIEKLAKSGYLTMPTTSAPLCLKFDDSINLTPKGFSKASEIMNSLGFENHPSLEAMLESVKEIFEKKATQQTLSGKPYTRGRGKSIFSDSFETLINNDPIEPLVTTIAMYTELDNQLNGLREGNRTSNELYKTISKAYLNLEIRGGRISSIVIPITLNGQVPVHELSTRLGSSWCWPGMVSRNSYYRYIKEAISLGLIQQEGGIIKSLMSGPTDTLKWLANKTTMTYINSIPTAPKVSLAVFRECFKYPTEDELISPTNSKFDWLQVVYDDMPDKKLYGSMISSSLKTLRDDTHILVTVGEQLVPVTVWRRVENVKDMRITFETILKEATNQNNLPAQLLVAVTAKPGITINDLRATVEFETGKRTHLDDVDMAVQILANKGLIHITRGLGESGELTRLYAFSQIPFLDIRGDKKSSKAAKEANAIIKSQEPWVLSTIKDIFPEAKERQDLYDVFDKLLRQKEYQLEEIDAEFGPKFGRKVPIIAYRLSPFLELTNDFSTLRLSKEGLAQIMMDIVQYSLLTGNAALSSYSQALSDMVIKDRKSIDIGIDVLKGEILEKNMK
jgi:hypothetical protein